MGGTVSLIVTKVNEDWQMNICFFLAFIVSILYHSLAEKVKDTYMNNISNTNHNMKSRMDYSNITFPATEIT